jgi:hypothetical protein
VKTIRNTNTSHAGVIAILSVILSLLTFFSTAWAPLQTSFSQALFGLPITVATYDPIIIIKWFDPLYVGGSSANADDWAILAILIIPFCVFAFWFYIFYLPTKIIKQYLRDRSVPIFSLCLFLVLIFLTVIADYYDLREINVAYQTAAPAVIHGTINL